MRPSTTPIRCHRPIDDAHGAPVADGLRHALGDARASIGSGRAAPPLHVAKPDPQRDPGSSAPATATGPDAAAPARPSAARRYDTRHLDVARHLAGRAAWLSWNIEGTANFLDVVTAQKADLTAWRGAAAAYCTRAGEAQIWCALGGGWQSASKLYPAKYNAPACKASACRSSATLCRPRMIGLAIGARRRFPMGQPQKNRDGNPCLLR